MINHCGDVLYYDASKIIVRSQHNPLIILCFIIIGL